MMRGTKMRRKKQMTIWIVIEELLRDDLCIYNAHNTISATRQKVIKFSHMHCGVYHSIDTTRKRVASM